MKWIEMMVKKLTARYMSRTTAYHCVPERYGGLC